jgi:hypothetical protein
MADARGSAIVEALIATAIAGMVWAAAAGVIARMPAQAAAWEEAAAARQRARAIETRVARMAAGAGPIAVEVDGTPVRVPAVWPRRLGLFRPGAAGEVSTSALTLLLRVDGHRVVFLAGPLGAGTSSVAFTNGPGCGAAAACGLRAGDVLLAVRRDGACGLYRVGAVEVRLDLAAIMEPGAPVFEPGSVLVPIAIEVLWFDPVDGALRRYDGYRSDNVMADGLADVVIEHWPHAPAALAGGPLVGTGALAYDLDQLSVEGVSFRLVPAAPARGAPSPGARPGWRTRRWP